MTAGELSPVPTGIVYCGAIEGCHEAYELRRAREWTEALTGWCEQLEMVAFTGPLPRSSGRDHAARGGLGRSAGRSRARGRAGGHEWFGIALAHYRRGDLLRLRGEFAAAEEAYRDASRFGREPQPGLALLRLAQRNAKAAAATIRRAYAEATEPSARVALLPAHVEIMLAVDAVEDARLGGAELGEIAGAYEAGMVGGAGRPCPRRLRTGERKSPDGGAGPLRRAAESWQELGAPYEAARSRVLVALACQTLGDGDAADMELDAARTVFAELGAEPDLERVGKPGATGKAGLTGRELDVLRLVAAGNTEQGDRRRAGPERADRRPPRQQHLRETRRLLTRRCHRVAPDEHGLL